MITAQYIYSLGEVRLYKDDGKYWPIKFTDKEEARGFCEFVNSKESTK